MTNKSRIERAIEKSKIILRLAALEKQIDDLEKLNGGPWTESYLYRCRIHEMKEQVEFEIRLLEYILSQM